MKTKKPIEINARKLSLGEEIGNAVTHGLGAVFSIVALILLLNKANSRLGVFAALIYSISMFFLYLMSCLYHAFKYDTTRKRVFRRFDHISIYLLIGGSYAPILLGLDLGNLGIILFIIQWIIITVGIVFKSIWPTRFKKIHIVIFLLIGWMALFFIKDLYIYSNTLFYLVLSGGIVYSLGIIFFGLKFKYSHFIWHFFVLGGTILHFIGFYNYIFGVLI